MMSACRIETTVSNDGTVVVKNVPFSPGEQVEVVVRSKESSHCDHDAYPLRGKPIRYVDPFEGVAQDAWETP